MKKWRLVLLTAFVLYCQHSFGQPTDSLSLAKSINSRVFGKTRDITISLPAEYYAQPQRRFPVAYVFDAQSEALFHFTRALMRYLGGTNSLDPMIVVGIKTQNRQFEFTPQNQTADPYGYNPQAKFWRNIKLGGADTLLSSLETEIFPFVEKNYRTLPLRLGLGHSLGGTFVTYCLTQNKSVFDVILAVSPNYAYDQEQLVNRVNKYVEQKNRFPTFFYLARGKKSELLFNDGIEKVVAAINNRKPAGLSFRYDVLDIDNHGNTLLEGFEKGLQAYHQSIYSRATTIIDYYTNLTQKAGYKLDAEKINQLAYDYFMFGEGYKEAIPLLAWAIQLYPANANLYDSMSEAQENVGNRKEARHYTLQALTKLAALKSKMPAKDYEGAKKYYLERLSKLQN